MNECNSIEVTNTYSSLSDQTKFGLYEINKIKQYFNSEIQERKMISKKLNKDIAVSDYFDKTLILFSVTSGGISIISFTSVIAVFAEIVVQVLHLYFL